MPIVTYVSSSGIPRKIDVPSGMSVMQAALNHRVEGILGECGGNCMCATCHVYVEEKFLPLLNPPDETENAMLESTASERKPNSRLSCQLRVSPKFEGLIVHTPPTQK